MSRLRATLRRFGDDRGTSDVAAMLVVVPLAMGVILLYSFVGRQAASVEAVTHAADVSARAAAQAGSPDAARAAASNAAATTLAQAGTACRGGPSVAIDADRWEPGGVITVTVSCSIETGDLGAIGAPGRAKSATSRSVIDTYREYAS